MSMSRQVSQRLRDILASCQAMMRYTEETTYEDYLQNDMMRDAVERRFGIIGEALIRAEKTDPDIGDKIPDIGPIVGMRNRLIHGYEAIDNALVWQTQLGDVPRLEAQVAALLDQD